MDIFPGSPELDLSLKNGQTLPYQWYTDSHFYDLEKRNIFSKSWHYAGQAELLKKRGDFITCQIAEVPVIVIRKEDGQLNGFVNVCRHRGSQIVLSQSGSRKMIQCHYHAWTWDLDGCLKSAPAMEEGECFSKENYPLKRVLVEEWGPFVFVNLAPEALPFKTQMSGLMEAIAETEIDLLNLKHHQQLKYEINANWKITMENYLECYHCVVAHPELVKIVRMDNYKVYPYDYYSVQRCSLRPSGTQSSESDRLLRGAGTFVWPNFTINIYPGIVNVSTTVYLPVAVDKTIAIYDVYFPEGITESDKASVVSFLDQVQKEDTVLCEAVHTGLKSGYYQGGPLVLSKENGVQHLQRLIFESLREELNPLTSHKKKGSLSL